MTELKRFLSDIPKNTILEDLALPLLSCCFSVLVCLCDAPKSIQLSDCIDMCLKVFGVSVCLYVCVCVCVGASPCVCVCVCLCV